MREFEEKGETLIRGAVGATSLVRTAAVRRAALVNKNRRETSLLCIGQENTNHEPMCRLLRLLRQPRVH